jgi:YHS domain-containing protein
MVKILLISCFVALATTVCFAQNTSSRAKMYNLSHGLAIEGYDPVSYFSGKPQKGTEKLTHTVNGITYRFANEANLTAFKAAPQAYEPQYGGWCAYAMGATGEKVEVDPETYKIVDKKLFLFYNKLFTNTLKSWTKNEAALHSKADVNWQKMNIK